MFQSICKIIIEIIRRFLTSLALRGLAEHSETPQFGAEQIILRLPGRIYLNWSFADHERVDFGTPLFAAWAEEMGYGLGILFKIRRCTVCGWPTLSEDHAHKQCIDREIEEMYASYDEDDLPF